jgi:hypothetical protein
MAVASVLRGSVGGGVAVTRASDRNRRGRVTDDLDKPDRIDRSTGDIDLDEEG